MAELRHRGRLRADRAIYASAPGGISAGSLCGHFLVDQVGQYTGDLGFDGILYSNQLGTRGRWWAGNGPGYSDAEAAAIQDFLYYSRMVLGDRELMWLDSYNNVQVAHDTWSVPATAYADFDYLIAAGFCVLTSTEQYRDDLESKLLLKAGPRILATLDYVDPCYTYNAMTSFPEKSARLEDIAIQFRARIAGLMFFANDEQGGLVPEPLIRSFASRFFGVRN